MPRRLQRTEGTLPLSPGRPRVKSKWSLPELGPFNCLLEVKEQPRQPTDQYILEISPGGIEISATTPAMAFHAAQTLRQLLRQFPRELPCLRIDDWPDFPARGVMLDISRDKVPTMATLFALVDLLAELKINQLQLYTEHTFAYSQTSSSLARRLADDRRRNPPARRLLPRALHRAGAQSELLRPHGALAEASAI